MANTSQARKRARQAETRRTHNQQLRSRMRTAIKKAEKASSGRDAAAARAAFQAAVPEIDAMVGKGILTANTAARYKRRLNLRLKALAASS